MTHVQIQPHQSTDDLEEGAMPPSRTSDTSATASSHRSSINLTPAPEAAMDLTKETRLPARDDVEHIEKESQGLALTLTEDPLQWSPAQKWLLTLMVSSTFLNCTLASSAPNAASKAYIDEFGASQEVATLVLSLYMVGFALGPLVWAPVSEWIGRKRTIAIAIPCFALCNLGCAMSKDMASLLVLRVFAGFFGGCPQSTAGATIADIWSPAQRPWPMLLYTFCAFGGPVCGPWVGGFLYVSGNWRWIYWLVVIFAGVNSCITLVFQRETYAPVLLRRKTQNGSKDTPANKVDEHSVTTQMSVPNLLRTHMTRPFSMLFNPRELPLIYAAVWTGWSYALLFIFFEAYPVIFGGIYGFNAGEAGLCFLGFGVGICLSIPVLWYFNHRSAQLLERNGGRPLLPEDRLAMVSLTAPMYIIGFIWFGWSARANVHWIVCVIGTVPIGTAVILSFNALTVYVSQCYTVYAASALGSMAFSRCTVAIFMPLFGRQMYQSLGPGWASTILAFVSLLAVPGPFIFAHYGARIRQRSTMAISSV